MFLELIGLGSRVRGIRCLMMWCVAGLRRCVVYEMSALGLRFGVYLLVENLRTYIYTYRYAQKYGVRPFIPNFAGSFLRETVCVASYSHALDAHVLVLYHSFFHHDGQSGFFGVILHRFLNLFSESMTIRTCDGGGVGRRGSAPQTN